MAIRRIIASTIVLQADGDQQQVVKPDDYAAKLMKMAPSESFVTLTTIDGIFRSIQGISLVFYWILFSLVLVGTPLYLLIQDRGIGKRQLALSLLAFLCYALAQGSVFEKTFQHYSPIYGAMLTPVVVFLAPLISAKWLGK